MGFNCVESSLSRWILLLPFSQSLEVYATTGTLHVVSVLFIWKAWVSQTTKEKKKFIKGERNSTKKYCECNNVGLTGLHVQQSASKYLSWIFNPLLQDNNRLPSFRKNWIYGCGNTYYRVFGIRVGCSQSKCWPGGFGKYSDQLLLYSFIEDFSGGEYSVSLVYLNM